MKDPPCDAHGIETPHIPEDHVCSHLCNGHLHYARAEFVDDRKVPDLRLDN